MPNTVPYEVIAAPATLYLAPVGTAFPDLDEAPAVAWVKVGSLGPLNYDEAEGVGLSHDQETRTWRSSGDSGARKIFRISEDQKVNLKLVDVTLEQYAIALNHNTVTDTAAASGVPGKRKIGLSRGSTVATRALLIRWDASPYGEDFVSQYEIPVAAQTGSPKLALAMKGVPAGLDLEWTTLVDPDAASPDEYFGRYVAQDADAI